MLLNGCPSQRHGFHQRLQQLALDFRRTVLSRATRDFLQNTKDSEAAQEFLQGVDQCPGPAFKHALSALEWRVACQHIASFASTLAGRLLCEDPEVAICHENAERLQSETRAVSVLEVDIGTVLDFGGISTQHAATALRRARKGALLTGGHTLGVAGLIDGASNLQRILGNARQACQGTLLHAQIAALVSEFLALEADPCVSEEIISAVDEEGNVRDSASDNLRSARSSCISIERRLRNALAKLPGDVTVHAGRLCVAVPDVEPGSKSSGIVLGSGVGVQYVEPGAAVALNNQLVAAQAEALAAEEAVLACLTQLVADRAEQLGALLDGVARLDAARARSRYTEWIGGTLPTLVPFPGKRRPRGSKSPSTATAGPLARLEHRLQDESEAGDSLDEEEQGKWVHLMRLRHPLLHGWYLKDLAAWNKKHTTSSTSSATSRRSATIASSPGLAGSAAGGDADGSANGGSSTDSASGKPLAVVPINISIEDGTKCVVITGPNTGGKTASLKALGLSALLTQSGCGVPARAPARMPVFSAVLADIGDSQGLPASLSTFSGHLRRISAARMESDSRSLVLLDELGTGTDPAEGSALAAALLSRLVQGGPGGAALTVATTHMSSLARLKFEEAGGMFENASAEFDEDLLRPTYRLLWGIPGRSCALAVAGGLGVPQGILQEAREVVGSSQVRMEGMLGDLERLRRAADASISALERSELQQKLLETQVSEAERRREGLRTEADLTHSATVIPAAEAILRRLQRQRRQQEQESEAVEKCASAEVEKKQAKSKQARVQRKVAQQKNADWRPQAGDLVEVPKLGVVARVHSVVGQKVSVSLGSMPITVKLSDVLKV